MISVGNLLKEKREAMNLSIDDIASKTRIQKKYIEAIEADDFSFFSGQSFYQQVFMGTYADAVGLNKNELLNQLLDDRKEYETSGKAKLVNNHIEESNDVVETIANEEYFESNDNQLKVEKEDDIEDEIFVSEKIIEQEIIEPVVEDAIEQPIEEILETVEDPNLFEFKDDNMINLEDIFAQLNNDEPIENNEEVIEDDIIEEVIETKSGYPIPKIYDKILTDVGVNSLDTNKEEKLDDILIDDIFNDENINADIDDLNNLIKQINEDLDPELSDISNEVDLLNEQIDSEMLNSSILDDIQKISEEVEIDPEFDRSVIETGEFNVENLNADEKEPTLESTAVIDITSGIELEKIPSERVNVELEEDKMNLDDLFAPVLEEDEKIDISEKLIKELEDTMDNKQAFDSLQQDIETEKTSMDLKVAQALGGAKESVNSEIADETKRFSALDYLLIIVFVILVISLGYIAYQYLM